MASTSRVDRLISILGGEQNLPPQLAGAKVESATRDTKNLSYPEPEPEATVEAPAGDEWWHRLPTKDNPPHADISTITPSFAVPVGRNPADLAFDTHKDQQAPTGIKYSPFLAITKFCYKFVDPEWKQPLATAFFDAGKIFQRGWSVYYIWSGYFVTAKPITFVPEQEVVELIEDINKTFPSANIKLNDEAREEGLVIDFDDIQLADLRPRWLGRCTSKEQYESWINKLPMPAELRTTEAEDRSLQAFKAKMELAIEVSKNRSKAKKTLQHEQKLLKRQQMAGELLTAQKYLGLVRNKDSSVADISTLSLSHSEDIILIAVDVEAFERSPHVVTEIGVATLDTRDLRGISPGRVGEEWQKFVRARHFRIAEYKHLVNKDFVDGCPTSFEFGESEFVNQNNMPSVLASCFRKPFSKDHPIKRPGEDETTDDSPTLIGKGKDHADVPEVEETRKLVLVGHDVSQDVNYLRSIGFDVFNRGNLNESLDTASMFRAYSRDPNSKSLGGLLYDFDLVGWNLHNAGNDAVYTLWVLLAIAVQSASGSGPDAQKHAENFEKRTQEAVEQAKQRVKESSEGWELEDSDSRGGGLGKDLYTSGGAPLDV